MNSTACVWIDHKKAVIVFLDCEEQPWLINCKDDTIPLLSGKSAFADDARERTNGGGVEIYYNEIIAFIRDAESVLIFGSRSAKGELERRLGQGKSRAA